MLGQQTLHMLSTLTPNFGSSTPKGARSFINASEGRSNASKKIMKTLALLEVSTSKNSTAKKDYDLTNESSLYASHNVNPLKINFHDNPCYSSIPPIIMQAMIMDASSIEEQLANTVTMIEGLTKHMQH